jgi:hypothetical protein
MIGPPIPQHIKEIRLKRGVYKTIAPDDGVGDYENTANVVISEPSSEDEFGPPIPTDEDADVAEEQALERLNGRNELSSSQAPENLAGPRSDWLNAALGIKEQGKPSKLAQKSQLNQSKEPPRKQPELAVTTDTPAKPVNPKVAQLLGTGIGSRFSKAGS